MKYRLDYKRFFFKTCCLFILFCLTNQILSAQKSPRPNIILIITDQQFADAMSFRMGHEWISTPNMDALASQGVFFTKAYAANPLCAPSRNAIITGQYPHVTGIQTNGKQDELYKSNNYFTARNLFPWERGSEMPAIKPLILVNGT